MIFCVYTLKLGFELVGGVCFLENLLENYKLPFLSYQITHLCGSLSNPYAPWRGSLKELYPVDLPLVQKVWEISETCDRNYRVDA